MRLRLLFDGATCRSPRPFFLSHPFFVISTAGRDLKRHVFTPCIYARSCTRYLEGDFAESRYFKQLRIFVQLRSGVEQQFEKAMETVSNFFKEEKDFLYRKGEVKGREEEQVKIVTNLVAQLGLSDEQVADIAEVPVSFVKGVRGGLKG